MQEQLPQGTPSEKIGCPKCGADFGPWSFARTRWARRCLNVHPHKQTCRSEEQPPDDWTPAPEDFWMAIPSKHDRSKCAGCGWVALRGRIIMWSPKFRTVLCQKCHRCQYGRGAA